MLEEGYKPMDDLIVLFISFTFAQEKATGSTYYDELLQHLLEPVGLTQTSPANRRDLPGPAPGYLAPDNPFATPIDTYCVLRIATRAEGD